MKHEPKVDKLRLVTSLFISLTVFTISLIYVVDLENSKDNTDRAIAGVSLMEYIPQEETGYLTNPGIGWQHFPGIGDQLLPETVTYPDRADISWKVLNPAENVYDWKNLDDKIQAAKNNGQQIGIRIYTMRGESFGGHQVPTWALDKGITLIKGAPDYNNCTYQDLWAKFVEQLRLKYDGNQTIAFIDISGYGNFNEWSWEDEFTEFDDTWATAYSSGKASPSTMSTMDAKTRRRLADIFIGGAFTGHDCKNSNGTTSKVDYSYPGFQKSQLIMPYAGIRQQTQYVYLKRKDVGFRFDCLGRETVPQIMDKVGTEINGIWKNAPIIFEYCAYDVSLARSTPLLQATHASLVHDNLSGSNRQQSTITDIMKYVGYRFVLKKASFPEQVTVGKDLNILMNWHNVGYAPTYPKMGQRFKLNLHLVNTSGQVVKSFIVNADISKWYPATTLPGTPSDNPINQAFNIGIIPAGQYALKVSIFDEGSGKNIKLGIKGGDSNNLYSLGNINVTDSDAPVGNVYYDMHLNVLSPSDTTNLQINEPLVISVFADLPNQDNSNPNASKVILNYNPLVLKAESISEGSDMLALNKNIDNTNGKITVDVAKTSGNFVGSTNLANITFTLKSKPDSTTISIDPATTLGIPNRLNLLATTLSKEISLKQPYTPTCGNSQVDPTEQCDDGNLDNNDGCSSECQIEIVSQCGNSIVEVSEVCDSNSQDCTKDGYAGTKFCNDSCSAFGECVTAEFCGDGIINGLEACDDGNNKNEDFCSSNCKNKCTAPKIWNGSKCYIPDVQSPKPDVKFSFDKSNGNVPLTVAFKDESLNNPTSWFWNFGDGNTSTEKNPTHTYNSVGKFTVSLTAYNEAGANTKVVTKLIQVNSVDNWSDWYKDLTNTTRSFSYEIFEGRLFQAVRGSNKNHDVFVRSTADGVFDGINSESGEKDIKEYWDKSVGLATNYAPSLTVFKGELYLSVVKDGGKMSVKTMNSNGLWSEAIKSEGNYKNSIATKSFIVNGEERVYQATRGTNRTVQVRYSNDGNFDGSNTSESWKNLSEKSLFDVDLEVYEGKIYLSATNLKNKIILTSSSDGENWAAWQELSPGKFDETTIYASNGVLYQAALTHAGNDILIRSTKDGINWSEWRDTGSKSYLKAELIEYKGKLYLGIVGRNSKIYAKYLAL